MKIGEFTFRTKDRGFLQPEPAPTEQVALAAFVPEEARPLPQIMAWPARVQLPYLAGDDSVLWVEGAFRHDQAYTMQQNVGGPYLTGVVRTAAQPAMILRSRAGIHHYDIQARHQAANTYKGGASFFATSWGNPRATGAFASGTLRHPGGGPTVMRTPPRNTAVIRVPRYSTLPRQIEAKPVNSRPGVRLPGARSSVLSDLQALPRGFIPPQGVTG